MPMWLVVLYFLCAGLCTLSAIVQAKHNKVEAAIYGLMAIAWVAIAVVNAAGL